MLYRSLVFIGTLCFVCASATRAQDLCFRYLGGGGGIFVAKGQTAPGPNTCKPFNAVEKQILTNGGTGTIIGGLTGTVCTEQLNPAGIPVYDLHYSSHACRTNKDGRSYFDSGFCRFEGRPPIKGWCRGTVVAAHPTKPLEGATFLLDAFLENCNFNLEASSCPP
jgi:hypothetical protein